MIAGWMNTVARHLAMARYHAWVSLIVRKPPGSDKGLSDAEIARAGETDFSRMSTWEMICEEMLDTQHPRVYFERAREELRRRGITDQEIDRMRRFAWLTVGWLNFEMMAWEWLFLGEEDILYAIEWQSSGGWISQREKERRSEYLKRYIGCPAAQTR